MLLDRNIISKIVQFVKSRSGDIILIIIVALISLLSFGSGFLVAKYQHNEFKAINERVSFYITDRIAA